VAAAIERNGRFQLLITEAIVQIFELHHKRAVVTGSASGIGLAIATLFAESGAEVVLVDLDHVKAREEAEVIAGRTGASTAGHGCDVSNEAQVKEAFQRIGGPLDILVNCAGIAHVGNLRSTSPEDMDRLYAVNVRGTYLCMREGLALMPGRKGGVIVNMASIAATAGIADRFAYSMTRAQCCP